MRGRNTATFCAVILLTSPVTQPSPKSRPDLEIRRFVNMHNHDFVQAVREFDYSLAAWARARMIYDVHNRQAAQERCRELALQRAARVREEIVELNRQWQKVEKALRDFD